MSKETAQPISYGGSKSATSSETNENTSNSHSIGIDVGGKFGQQAGFLGTGASWEV